MSTYITIEECRKLIRSSDEWALDKKSLEDLRDIRNLLTHILSVRECFNLAKQLLSELEVYDGWFENTPIIPVGQRESIDVLLRTFQRCDDITHEEFVSLLDKADIFITDLIVRNPTLPIEILMEPSFLSRHVLNPKYSELVLTIRFTKTRRIKDVITHFRKIIPSSEYMSDEMLLKVAGA